ncbi:hypothetical protein [Flavobacterium agrisoli]|uniref:Uncharacterized protein n=1 Tax=Flavobacterium agrisoli TaxID=2793066 RepID=A0A934PKA0_9FLAO|nr:hypothetical protein [Flavobacterium agrisoli]MBK0368434.1 hypothetical protein [Flavobacterium agrisoli]
MKHSFFTFLLSLFIYSTSYCQEQIQFKNNIYKATPTWQFICNNYAASGFLKVQITTTKTGGILKIAIPTNNENNRITGNIYVDLKDVSFIVCTDKNENQYLDGETISYYNFTISEMERLKKVNIQDIRFSISGKSEVFGNQTGNFTAINQKDYFKTQYNTESSIFETATAIRLL